MNVNNVLSIAQPHILSLLFLSPTEVPKKDKDSEEKAGESLSDSSLFIRWGHDLGPESRQVALKKFQYYGYNGYLSDRLSLTRPIPDLRPDGYMTFDSFVGSFSLSIKKQKFLVHIFSVCCFSSGAETCRTPPISHK